METIITDFKNYIPLQMVVTNIHCFIGHLSLMFTVYFHRQNLDEVSITGDSASHLLLNKPSHRQTRKTTC